MDTITHGLAGALIGKGLFRGEDILQPGGMTRARLVTFATTLGAVFPDSDMLREILSRNPLLVMTWHRSITHSLVCWPAFALVLAGLTRWLARKMRWEAPSFLPLAGIYATGILSHIVLDLVTTFGTMIWSPLKWSRPAWDLLFIVDFTFAAILLVPQMVSWVYAKREGLRHRAIRTWLVFGIATLAVGEIAHFVGAPISALAVLCAIVILAAIFLLPVIRNWGLRTPRASWNFAGVLLAAGYIGLAVTMHHFALRRVEQFAAQFHLEAQSIAALPLPPSILRWDGLVETPQGVYEKKIEFAAAQPASAPTNAAGLPAELPPPDHFVYVNAAPNSYIEAAQQLPAVKIFFWFARFPFTRFRPTATGATVEFHDARFPQVRAGQPAPFTYVVNFNSQKEVLSQGWAK
jgi:membrane-bound metal-dependent hydrolase YbcI (DUF457 family)